MDLPVTVAEHLRLIADLRQQLTDHQVIVAELIGRRIRRSDSGQVYATPADPGTAHSHQTPILIADTPTELADQIRQDNALAVLTADELVLTSRQQEVAELVAEGLSNRQIAERLVISKRTVDAHVEQILTRLDFTSRAQVAAWVVQTPSRARQAGNPLGRGPDGPATVQQGCGTG